MNSYYVVVMKNRHERYFQRTSHTKTTLGNWRIVYYYQLFYTLTVCIRSIEFLSKNLKQCIFNGSLKICKIHRCACNFFIFGVHNTTLQRIYLTRNRLETIIHPVYCKVFDKLLLLNLQIVGVILTASFKITKSIFEWQFLFYNVWFMFVFIVDDGWTLNAILWRVYV